ncbi:MAG: DUF2730 family protein [Gammaproteobacteria bacterium]|nr:DUF2730 family protein [Gammaproteobacteria bacterium]
MGADYNEWRFWFDIVQLVATLLIGIYVWQTNKHKANHKAIKDVDEKVIDHQERILVIENEMTHVPGDKEISRIHNRIDQVGQGVKHIEGTVQQMNTTLTLIQQSLMESD